MNHGFRFRVWVWVVFYFYENQLEVSQDSLELYKTVYTVIQKDMNSNRTSPTAPKKPDTKFKMQFKISQNFLKLNE